MSKTVNIAGVFTTPYPPLTYTSDHASVTFSGDDMRLAPLAAEVREDLHQLCPKLHYLPSRKELSTRLHPSLTLRDVEPRRG